VSKTSDHIFKNFHRRVATPLYTVVLPYQTLWQYSDRDCLTGAKLWFSTSIWLWNQ